MDLIRRQVAHGLGVSDGIAIGQVFLIDRRHVPINKVHVPPELVDAEVGRLENAIGRTTVSLERLLEHTQNQNTEEPLLVLNAHLLMVRDPLLLEMATRQIQDERKCAEWALKSAVRAIRDKFDLLDDAYFRERRTDVDFVGERILAALTARDDGVQEVPTDAVVVAHNLSPEDVITLLRQNVRGLVTEAGSKTSHAAILARALEIPAVVGCRGALELCGHGDPVVVDGRQGTVLIDPPDPVIEQYRSIAKSHAAFEEQCLAEADLPAVTPDGHRVAVLANIDIEDEVGSALAYGAEGVGLYRTEFLYIDGRRLPSLDEHRRAYRYVLEAMGPDRGVTFRSFDLGSDKEAAGVRTPHEANPALGLRACRLALQHPTLFRAQLRAVLSCHEGGKVSLMFPMVSGIDELLEVKALVESERAAMQDEGLTPADVRMGVMIEVPSAVWVADDLAQEVDFFSVGTNDLIQYSLAIDRQNQHVAYLYQPLHPANLRALKHVVDAAHRARIPVGMCGEMAADPLHSAVLLGLGFDSLSMPNVAIPKVKWALRRLSQRDATALVDECLRERSAAAIVKRVRRAMEDQLPDLFG